MDNHSPETPEVKVGPSRRPLVTALTVLGLIALVAGLGAGGFFGYQAYTTAQTQTAVAVTGTAVAHQQSTSTQVAVVTATAERKATYGAIVAASSTARQGLTATTIAESTATAEVLLASVGSIVPSDWKVWRSYDFSEEGDWYTGTDTDKVYGVRRSEISDGEFIWDLTAKRSVIYWDTPTNNQVTDFYVSVDARRIEGSAETRYALLFRNGRNSSDYYAFELQENGFYYMGKYADKNSVWTMLRTGYTTVTHRNATNTLAVRGIGSSFTLYVNGTEIYTFEDTTYKEGRLGIGTMLPYGGLKAKVAYDNFFVLVP